MSEWYLSRGGGQEGPMTADELSALVSSGGVNVNEAHAWKEGMADWQSVAACGFDPSGASPAAQLNVPAAGGTPSAQVASAMTNPYAAPQAQVVQPASPTVASGSYGGIGRLKLWLFGILGTLAFLAILFALDSEIGLAIGGIGFFVGMIVAGVLRLKNLGMSGWMILVGLVPILNYWLQWRMLCCPEGYDDTKALDGAGKVLSGLYIALIVLSLAANFV